MRNEIHLAFFDLFQRLRREVGIELDLGQYQCFLHAFIAGKWKKPRQTEAERKAALLNLCKTFWMTRAKYAEPIEILFGESYQSLKEYLQLQIESARKPVEEASTRSGSNEIQKTQPASSSVPSDLLTDVNQAGESIDPSPDKKTDEPDLTSPEPKTAEHRELHLNFDKSSSGAAAGDTSEVEEAGSILETPFLFVNEKHLPLSYRRAQNIWKKLRTTAIREESDQIDIVRTIRQLARDGFLVKPSYRLIKKTNIRLLLLYDASRPMLPFADWGDQLRQTLSQTNRSGRIDLFYFDRYPQPESAGKEHARFKLYNDPFLLSSTPLDRLFKSIPKTAQAIIFSDAGALTNGIDDDRIRTFWQFLNLIKPHYSTIVWINPLPRPRWQNTPAEMISYFMPMVPFDEPGLLQAVKLLQT